MFKKPEEIILAILGIIWIVLVYFIVHRWLDVSTETTVQVLLYNIVWVVASFAVWKNEKIYITWPICLGLFVASWMPLLTWHAQKSAGYDTITSNLICTQMPWYATWQFKFGVVSAVVIIGYIVLLIQNRKK